MQKRFAPQDSALTLLEPGVFLVDDVDAPFAAHDFAFRRTLLDGSSHFHVPSSLFVAVNDAPPRQIVGGEL